MILGVIGHNFVYETECVVRLFYPGNKITVVRHDDFTGDDAIITRIEALRDTLKFTVRVKIDDFDKLESVESNIALQNVNAECERQISVLLFKLLCEKTGKRPAWGVLTGIRPIRLGRNWSDSGLGERQIFERMTKDYLVTPEKAKLCLATGKRQEGFLAFNTPDSFSLYIGIPFCPTRCLYCSFVSHAVDRAAGLIPDYVRLLCEEIRHIGKISGNMKLITIYIGGGTPTSLDSEQLGRILSTVRDSFDFSDLLEYTVEAGRADTVTAEKLETMIKFGVDRISINPQSMNDGVLKAIGRGHNQAQVEESYKLARQAGFLAVNMDLIAGLPPETFESFSDSLDKVIGFKPENITVHALTLKRSSRLRESADAFSGANPDSVKMHEHAIKRLVGEGYAPYYLYRQKPSLDNLENIGFSKPGHECAYNIYSMEDRHNILAAGAGGVSKLCSAGGVVKRISNHKYPYEYIDNFRELLNRKTEEIHEVYHS